MQPASLRFPPQVVAVAQGRLQEFVDANSEVNLAVLTSGDGFEVAAHPRDLPVAQRLAAMSSSMQALSEAIVREAGLGRARNLIIESDGGTIVVLGIAGTSSRLSLAVVASGNEILGRLLWASRGCCASLERSLENLISLQNP
jgi:predicted regulator of Ras-like GTPase activity (Roadblock/LC7/MglB family)